MCRLPTDRAMPGQGIVPNGSRSSGQQAVDDAAMHVGQPEVPSLVLERQLLVVDA